VSETLLNEQTVLFRGSGSPDRFSLWRTDGTAFGTKPISVLGALNRGLGFAPCHFMPLGDRLVSQARMVSKNVDFDTEWPGSEHC
jgi:hypothetical protein